MAGELHSFEKPFLVLNLKSFEKLKYTLPRYGKFLATCKKSER